MMDVIFSHELDSQFRISFCPLPDYFKPAFRAGVLLPRNSYRSHALFLRCVS